MTKECRRIIVLVLMIVLVFPVSAFAAVTGALDADSITVTNNSVGTLDTVEVEGVATGDIVKVYSAATLGTLLGVGVVATGDSVTVYIPQIGATAASVYVTLKTGTDTESTRTASAFTAEGAYANIAATQITTYNNGLGTLDRIVVTDVEEGDIIRAYAALTKGSPIAVGVVGAGQTSITLYVYQLGAKAGNVYVTGQVSGKLESTTRTAKAYIAETTPTITLSKVTITNNKDGVDDTVAFTGLASGDVVKVYSVATGGTALGFATVGTGATTTTVSIEQLSAAKGTAYITLTNVASTVAEDETITTLTSNESKRLKVSYTSEYSTAPVATKITVYNWAGEDDDTISITGLASGDVVNVYEAATGGESIGTGEVPSGATIATADVVSFGATKGNAYFTVTSLNRLESPRTKKAYSAEPLSTTPTTDKVTITNNKTIEDVVALTGFASGDVINVYAAATGGDSIGTATVAAGATTATIYIDQIGAAKGNAYVTVTSLKYLESKRLKEAFIVEPTTYTAPAVTAVSSGIATATGSTTITLGTAVPGLVTGDIVVKKGSTTLTDVTDYTLTVSTSTSVLVTFKAAAALTSASVVTVTITKTGYTINTGTAIAVTNTIP